MSGAAEWAAGLGAAAVVGGIGAAVVRGLWRDTGSGPGAEAPVPATSPVPPPPAVEDAFPPRPMPTDRTAVPAELARELGERPEGFPAVAQPQTSYDRIGGRPAVRAVTDALYDRLLRDPRIGPVFQDKPVGEIKAHMRHLLSVLLIGDSAHPDAEESWAVLADLGAGQRASVATMLERKHLGLNIDSDQYDRLLSIAVGVFGDAGVPEDVIEQLAAALVSYRRYVVHRVLGAPPLPHLGGYDGPPL